MDEVQERLRCGREGAAEFVGAATQPVDETWVTPKEGEKICIGPCTNSWKQATPHHMNDDARFSKSVLGEQVPRVEESMAHGLERENSRKSR